MKRVISLILATIMVLSAVCCMGFTASAEPAWENVALAKGYTNSSIYETYEGLDGGLTDNVRTPYNEDLKWEDKAYTALNSSTGAEEDYAWVLIDLEEVFHIDNVVVTGVNTIGDVVVLTSLDNKSYVEQGKTTNTVDYLTAYAGNTKVNLGSKVHARYVKVLVGLKGDGQNVAHISEISVYGKSVGKATSYEPADLDDTGVAEYVCEVCKEKVVYQVPAIDPQPQKREITPARLDGILDDEIWATGDMITVDETNGKYQSTRKLNKLGFYDQIPYRYEVVNDGEYLYLAVSPICNDWTKGKGNGYSFNVRLWINSDPSFKAYNYFYDAWIATDGTLKMAAKLNRAKNGNKGAEFTTGYTGCYWDAAANEGKGADLTDKPLTHAASEIQGAYSLYNDAYGSGFITIELKIPMSEFCSGDEFYYTICVSNDEDAIDDKDTDNNTTNNVCLHYPVGADFPYSAFDRTAAFNVVLEGNCPIHSAGFNGDVKDSIILMAADEKNVLDLTKLGSGKENKLEFAEVYVCNAAGIITEAYTDLGQIPGSDKTDKSAVVCPKGGFILVVGSNKAMKLAAGKQIVLVNVDVEAIRGAKGNAALENATFLVKDHTCNYCIKGTELPSLAKETELTLFCLCGKSQTTKVAKRNAQIEAPDIKNFVAGITPTAVDSGSDYGTKVISCLNDGKISRTFDYNKQAIWFSPGANTDAKTPVLYDLGSAKKISSVDCHLLFGANSNGVYSPKSVTVEVSTDNKTFKKVAEKVYGDGPAAATEYSAQWCNLDFDEVEARYVKITFERPAWLFDKNGDKDGDSTGTISSFLCVDEIIINNTKANYLSEDDADYMGFPIFSAGLNFSSASISILAGDNVDANALSLLGAGSQKDLHYGTKIMVNKDGYVVKVDTKTGGDDGIRDWICPAGGYIIWINADSSYLSLANTIVPGYKLTLHGVNVDAIRGARDFHALKNAYVTVEAHSKHNYTNYVQTVAPSMNAVGKEVGTCFCGQTNTRDIPALSADLFNYDGKVSDAAYTNWIKANQTNGRIEQAKVSDLNKDLAFDFATYDDGVNLYVAMKTDKKIQQEGGNGKGFTFRFWFHYSDFKTTVFTKFAHVIYSGDTPTVNASMFVYDAETKSNSADPTSNISVKVNGEHELEVCIPLSELTKDAQGKVVDGRKITYFASLGYSDNTKDNWNTLYYPTMASFPAGTWDTAADLDLTYKAAPAGQQITYGGFNKDATGLIILTGDGKTVADLTKLGTNGDAIDLKADYKLVAVNASNLVVKVANKGTEKADITCPAGGYILVTKGTELDGVDAANVTAAKTYIATLYNISATGKLADALFTGKVGYVALEENTKVNFAAHEHKFESYVEVNPATLAKDQLLRATCTCGATNEKAGEKKMIVLQDLPVNLLKGAEHNDNDQATYTCKLTDGITASVCNYIKDQWYNIQAAENQTVTVTLDSAKEMNLVRIHYLNTNNAGVTNFKTIKVLVSKDGTNFDCIASESYAKNEATTSWNAQWLTYTFPTQSVKAVRVIGTSNSNMTFIDEIEGYKGAPLDESKPEGAIAIDYAGIKYASGYTSLLAGDDMTVAQLTALGNNGASKDLNYGAKILVNADNIVEKAYFEIGAGTGITDWICPKGGYIIWINADKSADFTAAKAIQVGAKITVKGFDIAKMRGIADNQALVNAYFTFENPAAPVTNVVEVNVNENAKLTDGKKDITGNWGEAGVEDNVLLIQNPKCTYMAMDIKISESFEKLTKINTVKFDFYHCAGVMIGYPEGKITLYGSADGEKFDKIGEYDLAAATVELGKYGTVETVLEFDAVEVKAIYATVSCGDSTKVLGATPAGGKIFWEFASLTEVEAVLKEEPVEDPKTPGDIYGNDGVVNAMDYMLIRSFYLGNAKDLTEEQIKAMDVNNDGDVTVLDVALVKALVLGTKKPEDLLQK